MKQDVIHGLWFVGFVFNNSDYAEDTYSPKIYGPFESANEAHNFGDGCVMDGTARKRFNLSDDAIVDYIVFQHEKDVFL